MDTAPFSECARTVMRQANQEALRLKHGFVGTEHILLGLVKEDSVAADVLKNRGVDLNNIRLEVEKITHCGLKVVNQKLPRTDRVNKVIEYAMEEATRVGLEHVETGHLLLGILREGEGVASCVLAKAGGGAGLSLENVRTDIARPKTENNVSEPVNHESNLRAACIRLSVFALVCTIAACVWWLRPINLSNRFQTGLQAVKHRDWNTVRMCARDLRQDDNYQDHAYLLQAYELRSLGQTGNAFKAFSKAKSNPETREAAYHEAASILYEVGEYSEAILMCQQALQWNPTRADTLRILAALYYDIGAMIQAINTLRLLIEQEPDDHRPHYMQASILHDFERFGDAALAYEQAAKRIPEASAARDEVLAGWGACLVRLRRHSEAIEVMKPAASWPDVETQRAVALFELRKADESLVAAESALQQQPMLPEAVSVAARCYEINGDPQRGIALLQQAAEKHPYELELHLRLADMMSATGQLEDGLKHREIAARISEYRRDFSHKQQDLVHDDNNASLRFEIAQLAEKLGKIDIARSWLRAAVGMASTTEEIWIYWQQFQKRHPQQLNSRATSGQGN